MQNPFAVPAGAGPLRVTPTPDDGTRLTDRSPWDESARPRGPLPEQGRTYSPAEQAGGQHLVDVHDHLRAELRQVRDVVAQVAAGELSIGEARDHVQATTLRQNRWALGAYCASYCRILTGHHTLEDDAMLPHLRASDPRLAPVVDRLHEEHVAIHHVLEEVDRVLVACVAGEVGIAAVQEAVDVLTDALLSHLAYEERELVEPLARLGMFPSG